MKKPTTSGKPASKAGDVVAELKALGDAAVAAHSQRFFKTGVGEYGHGDRFIGVRVPVVRRVARQFASLSMAQNQQLLRSPLHEARLCALIMLVNRFAAARDDQALQGQIYRLYLANTRWINNWDLVDCSAYQIVGGWLQERSRAPLYRLVKSSSLWERRIAMMATWQFIRAGEFDDTMALAEQLLSDPHDLIHKVSGWMLREVAKRDRALVTRFLTRHYDQVPRTMLRYAIERYPKAERRRLMAAR